MSTAVPAPPRRRRGLLAALIVVLTLLLAGWVWLTGGFDPGSTPWRGEQLALGQMGETRFWDIAVLSASQEAHSSTIKIKVRARNKQEEAEFTPTTDILVVRMPDGSALTQTSCTVDDLGPAWQPGLVKEGHCEVETVDFTSEDAAGGPQPPYDIEVVLLDQQMSQGFVQSSHPEAGWRPVGWWAVSVTREGE